MSDWRLADRPTWVANRLHPICSPQRSNSLPPEIWGCSRPTPPMIPGRDECDQNPLGPGSPCWGPLPPPSPGARRRGSRDVWLFNPTRPSVRPFRLCGLSVCRLLLVVVAHDVWARDIFVEASTSRLRVDSPRRFHSSSERLQSSVPDGSRRSRPAQARPAREDKLSIASSPGFCTLAFGRREAKVNRRRYLTLFSALTIAIDTLRQLTEHRLGLAFDCMIAGRSLRLIFLL